VVAHTGSEGVAAAGRGPLEAALVDIGLPDRSGLSVGREIGDLHPRTPIVAVTAVRDATIARHALKIGFSAYLPKDITLHKFEQGLARILRGERIEPIVATAYPARSRGRNDRWGVHELTARELEVLAILVDGHTGPAMASRLSISPNTVRTHIQSILTKMQVHSRLEAAAFAVEDGLVDVSSRVRDARRSAVGA